MNEIIDYLIFPFSLLSEFIPSPLDFRELDSQQQHEADSLICGHIDARIHALRLACFYPPPSSRLSQIKDWKKFLEGCGKTGISILQSWRKQRRNCCIDQQHPHQFFKCHISKGRMDSLLVVML